MKTKKLDNKPRPTIVFGDIHGSTYWKKVVKENFFVMKKAYICAI